MHASVLTSFCRICWLGGPAFCWFANALRPQRTDCCTGGDTVKLYGRSCKVNSCSRRQEIPIILSDSNVNYGVPEFQSISTQSETPPESWPSWLRAFMFFLSSCRKFLGLVPWADQCRFLPYPFQISIYPVVAVRWGLTSWQLSKKWQSQISPFLLGSEPN